MALIVMADFDFGDCDFERKMVEAAGIQFKSFDDARNRTPAEIIEHLRGADGAITSYGRFTAEVFQALPQLKVVSKTGTGVDGGHGRRVRRVQCARLRHGSGERSRHRSCARVPATHQ